MNPCFKIVLIISLGVAAGCNRQSSQKDSPTAEERVVSPKDRLIDSATQIIKSSFGDADQPEHIANLTKAAVELEWTDWWEYQFFQQAAIKMTIVSKLISGSLSEKDRRILTETTKKVGAEVSYSLAGPKVGGTAEASFKDSIDDALKAKVIIDHLPRELQAEYQSAFDALLRGYEHLLVAAHNNKTKPIPVAERVVEATPLDSQTIVVTQQTAGNSTLKPFLVHPTEIPPPDTRRLTKRTELDPEEKKGRFPHEVIFDALFGGEKGVN